jgi:hypothetical protein
LIDSTGISYGLFSSSFSGYYATGSDWNSSTLLMTGSGSGSGYKGFSLNLTFTD